MRQDLPGLIVRALVVGLPAAAFAVFQVLPDLNTRLTYASPTGHFYIVSAVSLMAVALGAAMTAVAFRSPGHRLFLIALGFLGLAATFSVHGLATPGFILGVRFAGVTGFTARVAVLIAALFLGASALSPRQLPTRLRSPSMRARALVLVAWITGLAAFAVVALRVPESLPPALLTHRLVLAVDSSLVVTLTLAAAVVYTRAYLRSALPVYAAAAIGALLIGEAQVSLHIGRTWSATFWLYHVQLLMAFSTIGGGLMLEYARAGSAAGAFGRLGEADTLGQIRAGYNASIVSLAAALEARDGYTVGHGERVAALSLLIGEQMRLSPSALRSLTQGALLHDIGKIGIPDALLHKPGPLTADEYRVMQEHPARGYALLSSASPGETEGHVIRHHHERWDGGGYPDGISGEQIPLAARIAAVADVYDALRSARSYRQAWSTERARAHILEGSGTHFDPRCVEAFLAVADEWDERHSQDDAIYEERRRVA